MPGKPELLPQSDDRRRDHSEILGDERQLAELRLGGAEQLGTRACAPAAPLRGLVPGRDRPVRDEAAEMVDARHVDELEGAAQALDPPAVAGCAMRAPVVERIAPVLAALRQRVGRRARDLARAEELGVRDVLGASFGDVDRDVAEDAHAPLARVVAQRRPLALEANLVGERAASRRRPPSRRSRTGAARRSPRRPRP